MKKIDCDKSRRESMEYYGFGPEAMKQTRVCINCKKAIVSEEAICPICGAALPVETLFDLYCTHHNCCTSCGALLEPGGTYCPHCGKQLPGKEKQK